MQHVTSFSFLLLAYSNYLSHANHAVTCPHTTASPALLKRLAKRQVSIYLHISLSISNWMGLVGWIMLVGSCVCRWTTFLGIIRWECRIWWGTGGVIRRGSTTGGAHSPRCTPTRPTLRARKGRDTTWAQIQTRTYWLVRWLGGLTARTPSLTRGLSFRSPSQRPISTRHWSAFWLTLRHIHESWPQFEARVVGKAHPLSNPYF